VRAGVDGDRLHDTVREVLASRKSWYGPPLLVDVLRGVIVPVPRAADVPHVDVAAVRDRVFRELQALVTDSGAIPWFPPAFLRIAQDRIEAAERDLPRPVDASWLVLGDLTAALMSQETKRMDALISRRLQDAQDDAVAALGFGGALSAHVTAVADAAGGGAAGQEVALLTAVAGLQEWLRGRDVRHAAAHLRVSPDEVVDLEDVAGDRMPMVAITATWLQFLEARVLREVTARAIEGHLAEAEALLATAGGLVQMYAGLNRTAEELWAVAAETRHTHEVVGEGTAEVTAVSTELEAQMRTLEAQMRELEAQMVKQAQAQRRGFVRGLIGSAVALAISTICPPALVSLGMSTVTAGVVAGAAGGLAGGLISGARGAALWKGALAGAWSGGAGAWAQQAKLSLLKTMAFHGVSGGLQRGLLGDGNIVMGALSGAVTAGVSKFTSAPSTLAGSVMKGAASGALSAWVEGEDPLLGAVRGGVLGAVGHAAQGVVTAMSTPAPAGAGGRAAKAAPLVRATSSQLVHDRSPPPPSASSAAEVQTEKEKRDAKVLAAFSEACYVLNGDELPPAEALKASLNSPLMRDLVGSDWKVVDDLCRHDCAVVTNGKTKEMVIMFRGTGGWSDVPTYFAPEARLAELTESVLLRASDIAKSSGLTIKTCGHSLGAELARSVAVAMGCQSVVFNAPTLNVIGGDVAGYASPEQRDRVQKLWANYDRNATDPRVLDGVNHVRAFHDFVSKIELGPPLQTRVTVIEGIADDRFVSTPAAHTMKLMVAHLAGLPVTYSPAPAVTIGLGAGAAGAIGAAVGGPVAFAAAAVGAALAADGTQRVHLPGEDRR